MKSNRSFLVSKGRIESGMVLTSSRMFCAKTLFVNANPINVYMSVRFIFFVYCVFAKLQKWGVKNEINGYKRMLGGGTLI